MRLYLPETSGQPLPRGVPHRPVTGYIGSRRSLLVVDDQPTQRQMLAGMLLPLGFVIREAASGRECLESVHAALPDAVLLDLTMDDMDGWQTARQIRAAGFGALPIIVVSANAFENQPEKLAAARLPGLRRQAGGRVPAAGHPAAAAAARVGGRAGGARLEPGLHPRAAAAAARSMPAS